MTSTSVLPEIRAYQREMFERSMEGNRIIVVGLAESMWNNTIASSVNIAADGYWQWKNTSVRILCIVFA